MDYFKATSLINSDPSNPEVTKTIYNITRLHILETVYKYCSLTAELDSSKFTEVR